MYSAARIPWKAQTGTEGEEQGSGLSGRSGRIPPGSSKPDADATSEGLSIAIVLMGTAAQSSNLEKRAITWGTTATLLSYMPRQCILGT